MKITRTSKVQPTARLLQTSGLFDLAPDAGSTVSWEFPDPPLASEPWQIAAVLGPSGSGKSTVALELFAGAMVSGYEWPADKAIVDGFEPGVGIKDITGALSSVGFSSPPNWLRPYRVLSNGERFRADLARALLDPRPLVAIDEYTSVVDRQVAKAASAAVARAVRRTPGKRLVVVSCHDDIVDWLCPDWTLEMPDGVFTRRALRRPPVPLQVAAVDRSAWKHFRRHHYLSHDINPAARCFGAFWEGRCVAFAAVISAPGRVSFFREHRLVTLPDFQGLGIGHVLSEFVAGMYLCRGKQYRSTSSHPGVVAHRRRSPLWETVRELDLVPLDRGEKVSQSREGRTRATGRLTAGFRYVGPRLPNEAKLLGVTS